MPWTVELFPHAVRDYRRLSAVVRERMRGALHRLEEYEDPLRGPGVRALVGRLEGYHRLRVGDLRVIFELILKRKVIAVHRIVPRKEAYRTPRT